MSLPSSEFNHLKKRVDELIVKFIAPIVKAEDEALAKGEAIPLPDFDNLAAFRLLSHAELEGYFEKKAKLVIDKMDADFVNGKASTCEFSSLTFLHWSTKKMEVKWPENDSKATIKQHAQDALGFARKAITDNNGVKEASIVLLSAMMGFFSDELDDVLVSELNQYGKLRGDVAHDSWMHNTRTFDSAVIEKNRLENIVDLIQKFYEN